MGRRVELTHDNNTKSKAKFYGQFRSAIRLIFKYSDVKKQALRNASMSAHTSLCDECKRVVPKAVPKVNRLGQPVCHLKGKQKGKQKRAHNIEVDHIDPAGSLSCFDDISGFTERMFCGLEGLRVVCKECHQSKTNDENAERRKDAKKS